MAHIDQAKKKLISEALKIAMKPYPTLKYSLSIQHNSTITCKIKSGPKFLDPHGVGHTCVNVYWIDTHFEKETAEILNKIKDCLNLGNYNRSNSQSDYFDVGHYINIEIGQWDTAYISK